MASRWSGSSARSVSASARASSWRARRRRARLGLEHEGALLGDGLVVHGAELEEARRAVAVEDGAVGVAARGEAERQLVLAQRPGVVARLEQAVALLLELVRARRPELGTAYLSVILRTAGTETAYLSVILRTAGTAAGVGRERGPELGERATEMLEDLRESSRTGRESRRGGLGKIESNRFFL